MRFAKHFLGVHAALLRGSPIRRPDGILEPFLRTPFAHVARGRARWYQRGGRVAQGETMTAARGKRVIITWATRMVRASCCTEYGGKINSVSGWSREHREAARRPPRDIHVWRAYDTSAFLSTTRTTSGLGTEFARFPLRRWPLLRRSFPSRATRTTGSRRKWDTSILANIQALRSARIGSAWRFNNRYFLFFKRGRESERIAKETLFYCRGGKHVSIILSYTWRKARQFTDVHRWYTNVRRVWCSASTANVVSRDAHGEFVYQESRFARSSRRRPSCLIFHPRVSAPRSWYRAAR